MAREAYTTMSAPGRWARDAASWFVVGAALPWVLGRAKTRVALRDRVGLVEGLPSNGAAPLVWFHGASRGDVQALLPAMAALRSRRSHVALLTSMTRAGLSAAVVGAPPSVWVRAVPLDAPTFVRRFVARARPKLLVLERAELWPQLLWAVKNAGASVAVLNASIRPDRLGPHRRLWSWLGHLDELVDLVVARFPGDVANLEALGFARDRIRVGGDTKLDGVVVGSVPLAPGLAHSLGSGPLWVATSTHRSEEMGFLHAARRLRGRARLVIAPRELERARSIVQSAVRMGLKAVRRSRGGGEADVVVLDTFGELRSVLSRAQVAVLGGSFSVREGQNPYEAAAAGCPQIFGPRTRAHQEAVRELEGEAALRVAAFGGLADAVAGLLDDPGRREAMGRAGMVFVERSRGASARAAELLAPFLDAATDPPA